MVSAKHRLSRGHSFMRRVKVSPRNNYPKILEEDGFNFHKINGQDYWNEEYAYEFTEREILSIEKQAEAVQQMCVQVVRKMIQDNNYSGYWFAHKPHIINLIKESFLTEKALYGRFDFGYDGENLKLYEYNADTPTSLLESSVIQWRWLNDLKLPDQFNFIHEELIKRWQEIVKGKNKIYFTTNKLAPDEDWGNVNYLMETCLMAGIETSSIDLEDIGYSFSKDKFVDVNGKEIAQIFKLYPWEQLMQDKFADFVKTGTFIEPVWKLLLSNKVFMTKLWQYYPGHKNLLECYLESEFNDNKSDKGMWVKKPSLSREGNNIKIIEDKKILHESLNTDPEYEKDTFIYQQYFNSIAFENRKPVLGVWVVGETPCGMGIREDAEITTNNSLFIPHYFV